MKSSFFDVHGHVYTGVLWACVPSVFFGIVRIRTSTLRVPYGARVDTVCAHSDALRACEPTVIGRNCSCGARKDF